MLLLLRKLGAFFYDSLVICALLIGVTGACVWVTGQGIPAQTYWYQALLLGTILFYYAVPLLYKGQTIGMRVWKVPRNKNRSNKRHTE